jgi:carbamoyltransferase
MNILGISCFYHDSAAALIKDGEVVAAVEEERFTRKKHDNSFPENAVEFCMERGKIKPEELNHVVFHEKPILKFDRIIQTTIDTFPFSGNQFVRMLPDWINNKLKIRSIIKKKVGYNGKVLFMRHHASHAASAFLCSPFKEAAILTVDGVGEWTTTALHKGRGNEITPLKEIKFPHSLGLLYSTVTSFLGFKVNNDEYKVMGLSSYGKAKYLPEFEDIIDVKEGGGFKLNMKYFDFRTRERMWSRKFVRTFGEPRIPENKITQRDKDLAATTQRVLEDTLVKISTYLHQITQSKNLCISGGVALNCVANSQIIKKTPFRSVFIQPAATDAGSSIGCALSVNSRNNRSHYSMKNVYFGPSFTNDEIKDVLEKNELTYRELERSKLLKLTARKLSHGEIVGWFQGRMEFGPRALGNRSILANPKKAEMKDIINKRVKHREPFRPFAGTVLWEKASEYFDIRHESPFMLFTFDAKEKGIKKLPAILHVDNTSRLQTIKRSQNRLYYDLIREFEKISNVPCVLNTSFNVRSEPIVRTPKDAYKCFTGTGIDSLVIGSFIVSKKGVKG